MEIKYKVIALDLDGTLTNSQKEITDYTKMIIEKSIDVGIKIILASGRPVLGIKRLAEELKLYNKGGYILAYNGGHIIECDTDVDVLKKLIDRKYYHDICKCGRLFDVNVLTYDEVGVIAENDKARYVIKEAYNNKISIKRVVDLEKAVNGEVVKFMVVGEPKEVSKALSYMQHKFAGILNVFLSEPYFIEVTPLGIEKASALEILLSYLNISRKELMVIGDGLNDISMLKYAGFAVAMENAYDETKKYADYITTSNDDDGVAKAIEKFVFS